MRRPLLAVCLAATMLPVVAGCGGSPTAATDPSSGVTTSQVSASSRSPSGTATTTETGGSASTATAVEMTGPLCTADRLNLSSLGQQGAMGRGELGFALRNTGAVACHTSGFPGILWLSGAGAPLPTAAQRVTRDFFGSAPATRLVLNAGQSASFRLGVTHGQASSTGCVTAAGLQVIPPDDTHALRVTIPNGAYECGTATVSPLLPGTSAFG